MATATAPRLFAVVWPLVLAAVAALLVWLRRRRVPWVVMGRRPRKRHIVVRLVCGLLGLAIGVAIGVGTWRETQRVYTEAPPGGEMKVHVPTKPPPAPGPAGQPLRTVVAPARLLVHLIFVDGAIGARRVLHAAEHEIELPRDKGRGLEARYEVAGLDIAHALSVQQVVARREGQGAPLRLRMQGELSLNWRGRPGAGRLSRSGLDVGAAECLFRLGSGGAPSWNPLSVVAGPRRDLWVFCLATLVARDDPLRQVGAAELVARHADALRLSSRERHGDWATSRRLSGRLPVGGFGLVAHIGPSSLLLLVAAVLLTQLFAGRALACVGVVAALVLYVAALDRLALRTHLSRLGDSSAPLATRLVACRQAAETFFYQETAARRLRAVADDAGAPARLRALARGAARALDRGAGDVDPSPRGQGARHRACQSSSWASSNPRRGMRDA